MRKMFSRPAGTQEGPGAGTALAEPPREYAPVVLCTDDCDASCPARVQVVIETSAGPLGLCAHHGQEVFDQLILQGRHPPQPRYIGDLKPWM